MFKREREHDPPPVLPAGLTGWEYKIVQGGKGTLEFLNQLGAEGWELVAVTAQQTGQLGALSTSKALYYLKRPV